MFTISKQLKDEDQSEAVRRYMAERDDLYKLQITQKRRIEGKCPCVFLRCGMAYFIFNLFTTGDPEITPFVHWGPRRISQI